MIIPQAHRLSEVGEYYFSCKQQDIERIDYAGDKVLNLGIGSPDLCPSQATISRLVTSAKMPQNHGYQGYRGRNELRAAIASWYLRVYGVELGYRDEVLPLLGSKEGIFHTSMAFLNPGDEVLVPDPGYPTYSAVAKLLSARPRAYDLTAEGRWQVDIDGLERMDLSRVKLMWLNYPHMPTGARADPDLFPRLVALARRHGFLLINDNPYSLILNKQPRSILGVPGSRDVAIEFNSLSKSHNMAGWRVGWIAGAAAYLQQIIKVKSNIDSGMFLPIQDAAIAALGNGEDWHREQNSVYRERSRKVLEIFDLLRCNYTPDQVGMFRWAQVPDEVPDVMSYVDELLHGARVFIVPGQVFGSNGKRYIRISLCSDLAILEQARMRISQWLLDREVDVRHDQCYWLNSGPLIAGAACGLVPAVVHGEGGAS